MYRTSFQLVLDLFYLNLSYLILSNILISRHRHIGLRRNQYPECSKKTVKGAFVVSNPLLGREMKERD